MATSRSAIPRVKALHISTPEGYSGLLAKDSQHVFSYAPEVVAQNIGARGVSLTMPIRAQSYQAFPMLPAFQTFLPEGFLAERIVEKFSKTMRVDDMALLALSGANAIGRIRVSQSPEIAPTGGAIESLKQILESHATRELFDHLCERYLISSGIAGVQPKVLLAAANDLTPLEKTPEKISNARATPRGRALIIKAGGADFPGLTENEFHCMSIAKKLDLPVPDFWLSDDKMRFVIERFDIHPETGNYLGFEDMVSLQGKVNERKYEGSYESIGTAIRHNASPAWLQRSLAMYFASLVLSMVLRNGDAHLKNFGLLYTNPETDDCQLSPLYDIVCTTVYIPKDLPALSLNKKKIWPTRDALISFGRDICRVNDPAAVIDRTCDAAMVYRPDEESAIWLRMKAEIELGVRTMK